MSTMWTISEPISASYGFVSTTITSVWSTQAVGAGAGGEDGSLSGSHAHGASKPTEMYPSVPSFGRVQASQSSMSKSFPT